MTLEEVERQIADLERKHPDQEWRPWVCNDQPLALEHWGLVQRRIALSRVASWTPERRKAASERLKGSRTVEAAA